MTRIATATVVLALLAGCGGTPNSPTDVAVGETALIVWVNPRKNTASSKAIADPGSARGAVAVGIDGLGGHSVLSSNDGIAILTGIEPGVRTVRFSGGGTSGTVSVTIANKELRELAVSTSSAGATVMADIPYKFAGTVVEVQPSMTVSQINTALNGSNQIVLFNGGTYTGDYNFNGSDVTLFGAGLGGGTVRINGNLSINGSANRIRGTTINGTLNVDGSDFGMTSSRVLQAATVSGSNAVLLDNVFCAALTLFGSAQTVLENSGAPDLPVTTADCQ